MADIVSTSVVIPAYNEAAVVGRVVRRLADVGLWHEILVVDDGSTDATVEEAERAGARIVRHPYNKGNGAAVKSGIRHATGEFLLILDADGQHRPEDAPRLVAKLGDYDLVVGARSDGTQATLGRRLGNRLLSWLASYLTGRKIDERVSCGSANASA